jgi:hypothetical protein
VALWKARISTQPLWGFSSSNPYHSQSRAEHFRIDNNQHFEFNHIPKNFNCQNMSELTFCCVRVFLSSLPTEFPSSNKIDVCFSEEILCIRSTMRGRNLLVCAIMRNQSGRLPARANFSSSISTPTSSPAENAVKSLADMPGMSVAEFAYKRWRQPKLYKLQAWTNYL